MYTRNFILPFAWAILGCLTAFQAAFAGDYYSTVPFLPTVKVGANSSGATPVDQVYGKEYSHTDWYTVLTDPAILGDPRLLNLEDHDAFARPDPGQVVSWDGMAGGAEGNSGSVDAFDYPIDNLDPARHQVDALANHADLLFRQVTDDTATLLFSVTGDIDVSSVQPLSDLNNVVAKAHVHYEDPAGGHGVWAVIETGSAGPGVGPGVNHHVVEDLDALEVWGPEPPSHVNENTTVVEGFVGPANTADADRFSLDGDSLTGTSVFKFDIPTKTISTYISHLDIVSAVENLFLSAMPEYKFDDDTIFAVDVDATMVRDVNIIGRWDAGDELLFSIDPIDNVGLVDASGGPGIAPFMIDGGEIMHLVNLGPGAFSINFLSHGGHVWDTAFNVSQTFGYFFEDIDALEAVGTLTGDTDIPTPEPSSAVLLSIACAMVGIQWRRRKRNR